MFNTHRKTFLFLSSLAFILSFSVQATAALLPTLAEYFNQDPVTVGKLIWIYMLPYGLCALIWSPLSRKFSVKKILLFCLTFFSVAAFGVAFSANLLSAFLGRLAMGIFGSALIPLSLITIGKVCDSKQRPKHVGLFFSVGFGSGLLGVFLSGVLSWRFIYGIPALLGIGALLFGLKYLDDLDFRGEFKISYLATFKDKSALKLFSFIFVLSFLYHSVQQWLGVFLADKYNFSQFSVSFALTLSAMAAIFSESIGGFLSSRFGSSNIASLGLLSMVLFLVFSLVVGMPTAIFFLIVFWGMGWAFNHVGLSSYLTGLPDKYLRDASSLNSSLRFVSGGIGTYLGGQVISRLGFSLHFAIVGILISIIAFLIKITLTVNKPKESMGY
ncbi:MAG: MFS transporter [Candidatus Omnitrophica bacterium]|nr:MFS transporter [Candidatus Omnitrophota bacterium]